MIAIVSAASRIIILMSSRQYAFIMIFIESFEILSKAIRRYAFTLMRKSSDQVKYEYQSTLKL